MSVPSRWLAVLAACVTVLLLAAPAAAAQPSRPSAVVVLGDSAPSGEGAGDYEPGTRGEGGNWCHRSPHAYVHRTRLADRTVNLACSGATSAEVAGPQAAALIEVARRHRVTTVVVQVGANDDPEVTAAGRACIFAWLRPSQPGCAQTLGPQWPGRLARMEPKVARAVAATRAAMRKAGYGDGDYALVLASYASPVTEKMVPLHVLRGCPYRKADARWGRTVAVPALSDALRRVAERSNVRFLDLSRATEGHEACSQPSRTREWQRRLVINFGALRHGQLDEAGLHLFQESFHPNATGHAQLGRCLTEFVRSASPQGRCLVGSDGSLHAVPGERAPVPA